MQLLFLRNAGFYDPMEAEKFSSLLDSNTDIPPIYKLHFLYSLIIGFAEAGNIEKAEIYFNKVSKMIEPFITGKMQDNRVQVFDLISYQAHAAYTINNAKASVSFLILYGTQCLSPNYKR